MKKKETETHEKSQTPALDRVSYYARAVLDGEIVAGPHVRNACRRHFDDLANGHERGIFFSEKAAAHIFRFFEKGLTLSDGQFEGKPFNLAPMQCFILGSLFGWKRVHGSEIDDFRANRCVESLKNTPTRRFRRAFIEMGKGQGKSPLAGGIGLFGMTADSEPAAQIYAAAAKKEQAQILYQDAVKAARRSKALAPKITFSGGIGKEFNMLHQKSMSFFRPISKESGKSGSGPRPHMALCDEVHEHPDRSIMEMLERGFKFRQNPLLLMITNSGVDLNSVCWEEHVHAVKVAAGDKDMLPQELAEAKYKGEPFDDTTFSYVCALDSKHTREYFGSRAIEFMEGETDWLNAPTETVSALKLEAYVRLAIQNSCVKKTGQSVTITLKETLGENQVFAGSATTSSSMSIGGLQKERVKNDGMKKTNSTSGNTRRSGFQRGRDTDLEKLKSRLLGITKPQALTLINSFRSKAWFAPFAEVKTESVLTTIMKPEFIEGLFATNATLESVYSEIIRSLCKELSNTCEPLKITEEDGWLKVEFPADDPLEDESCWIKANPMLGIILDRDYLAGVVKQAKDMPGKRNGILRLHFCVWTDSVDGWMAQEKIESVMEEFDPEEIHADKHVCAAIDLSGTRDLTAMAFGTETGEMEVERVSPEGEVSKHVLPTYDVWVEAWTPKDNIKAREDEDKIPYSLWAEQKYLHAVAGERIRYDHVASRLLRASNIFKIDGVAYDNYAYSKFREECDDMGIDLKHFAHPQGGKNRAKPTLEEEQEAKDRGEKPAPGLWMPGSIKLFEDAVLDGRIRIRFSPVVMAAMMGATMSPEDDMGNKWFVKRKSNARIDPAVAIAMCLGLLDKLRRAPKKKKLQFFLVGG